MAMSETPSSTGARRAPRAGGDLARAFLVLGVICLPLGLTLPVMETTRLWVFKDSYSLTSSVKALLDSGEWGLGLTIAFFSMLTPALKALVLGVLHMRPSGGAAGWLARWTDRLGKWSLTDVLVVAILIVLWSGAGSMTIVSQPGLWFFAASAVSLMLASGLIVRDLGVKHAA